MRRDLDMAAMAVSYRDGETPASIAGDHGCSITTVISRLRRAGVVIRTLSAARKRAWAQKGRLVVPPEHRLYFNKLCRVLGRAAAEAELVSLTAERLEIPPKPSESAA